MAQIPVLEAAPGQGVPPQKGGWLLYTFMLLLILAVIGGGAWYLISVNEAKKNAQSSPEVIAKSPPLYVPLDPPFVVNFEAEQLVRFLQVTVQVMSRDPATIDVIKANDPVIRNDLLLLLGNQQYQTISSRDGKEKLRQEALNVVRNAVSNAGGKPAFVEAVYFTSFVMQ